MMYRRDGLIFMTLNDPHWNNPKIAKILPYESSNWGAFVDLIGTPVENLIHNSTPFFIVVLVFSSLFLFDEDTEWRCRF